MTDFIII